MDVKSSPKISKELRESYEKNSRKTIEKKHENMQQIRDEYRKMLKDDVGNKTIGIFGDYKHDHNGESGDNVIQAIASRVAQENEGYMVVAGKCHYVFKDGAMEKSSSPNEVLQGAIDQK